MISRRFFINGGIASSMVLWAFWGQASADDKPGFLTGEKPELCRADLRAKIEDQVNDLVKAVEAQSGKKLTDDEVAEITRVIYSQSMDIVSQKYVFID